MRFWSLLGWIIGVPFAFFVGIIILGGIGEGIGAVRKGMVDFFKYPKYHLENAWNWLKEHKEDIISYILALVILIGICAAISGLFVLFD